MSNEEIELTPVAADNRVGYTFTLYVKYKVIEYFGEEYFTEQELLNKFDQDKSSAIITPRAVANALDQLVKMGVLAKMENSRVYYLKIDRD